MEVYPGEGLVVVLMFLSLFCCISFQYTAKTVRQATFVDALGAARLPYVYLAVALLSYPVLWAWNRCTHRLRLNTVVALNCTAVATSLVLFWWLYAEPSFWVPSIFYVWISIAVALTLSQLWSLCSYLFDSRQAKRLFGLIGIGGLLGGMAGGQVARWAGTFGEARHALLAAAATILSAGLLALAATRRGPSSEDHPAASFDRPSRPWNGLAALRESRHLRLIGLLMVTLIVVSQIIDLQFNWAVESATDSLEDRTRFFGNFFTVMGATALAFQLLFTTRIHRHLGVGLALRVLPAALFLGTVGLLGAALFGPEFFVAAAVALKVGEGGFRYSIDDSTRELLFLPLPSRLRREGKAFIDVVVKRAAKGLAALFLLPVTFGLISAPQLGWITLALVGVWLYLAAITSREYVRAFRLSLEQPTIESTPEIDLSDATTLEILVQSLGSLDARQVLHGIDLLSKHDKAHLVPPLLLCHDEPQVRLRTLLVLRDAQRADAAPLIERCLSDDDADVRAEATRVLADLRHRDACDLMLPHLQSGDPGVRAAAIACLSNYGDQEMRQQAAQALRDMLDDADPQVRQETARAIGAVAEPIYEKDLVELLFDGEFNVVQEAVRAVGQRCARDGSNPLYLPKLISQLQNRRLKHDAREVIIAFGKPALPALKHFMTDPDESIWVRRALPKTLARIGGDEARDALIDSLQNTADLFLKQKLVEALDGMRLAPFDEPHRSSIVAVLEAESRAYLDDLRALASIDHNSAQAFERNSVTTDGRPNERSLLARLFVDRLRGRRRSLFGLLSLLYRRDGIWAAHRSLTQARGRQKADALEYLDNTVSPDIRRVVLPAIGDRPVAEKVSKSTADPVPSTVETLRVWLERQPQHPEEAFLVAGALFHVFSHRVRELYPLIDTLRARAEDELVRETAEWVAVNLTTDGVQLRSMGADGIG